MSADLLAEFDSYYGPKSSSQVWASDAQVEIRETAIEENNGQQEPLSASQKHADQQNPWEVETPPTTRPGESGQHVIGDEDWGDFEDGRITAADLVLSQLPAEISRSQQKPAPDVDPWAGFDHLGFNQRKPRTTYSDVQKGSNQAGEQAYFPRPQPLLAAAKLKNDTVFTKSVRSCPRPIRDENVLFDADDVTDDDEDFGDFAATESAPAVPTPKVAQDPIYDMIPGAPLIDFDDGIGDLQSQRSSIIVRSSPSQATSAVSDSNPFGDLDTAFGPGSAAQNPPSHAPLIQPAQVNELPNRSHSSSAHHRKVSMNMPSSGTSIKISSSSPRPTTAFATTTAEDESYDAWGDWEDQGSAQHVIDSNEKSLPRAIMDLPILLQPPKTASQAPPTNVPPPALLLSVFSAILELCQTQLLKPLTTASQRERDLMVSQSGVRDYLLSYLAIATVLARVIAGRRLRWKRDTLLAQSMRIGQAGAKTNGMKLASLDKSEDTREEREVTNVVRLWKLQVGKLRTALGAAGISAIVPGISQTIPVRTGQASEGAITAPKQCALCAIKRDERVHRADVDVQDSFGEYWVDHWGHKSCKEFWESKEHELRGR